MFSYKTKHKTEGFFFFWRNNNFIIHWNLFFGGEFFSKCSFFYENPARIKRGCASKDAAVGLCSGSLIQQLNKNSRTSVGIGESSDLFKSDSPCIDSNPSLSSPGKGGLGSST